MHIKKDITDWRRKRRCVGGGGGGGREHVPPTFFIGGGGAIVCLFPPPLLIPHFHFPLELYVYITLTNNYLAFFTYRLIILCRDGQGFLCKCHMFGIL